MELELDIDLDIPVIGFEPAAIEAAIHGQKRRVEKEDDLPDLPVQPICRLGDVFELDVHRISCANALEPSSYARLMQGTALGRTANLDCPYNVPTQGHITSNARHGDFAMGSGEMTREAFADFLKNAMAAPQAFLMPGALTVGWIDWRSIALLVEAGAGADLELINMLVWDKGAHAGQGSFWRSQHELAAVFRKPGATHLNNIQLGRHGRNRGNVLRYEGVNGFGQRQAQEREMHPTCKSVAMTRDLFIDCTARGEVVLDGFSGSGTTLIAAEQTGRVARVMDICPTYVEVAIRRWERLTGRLAVHAATGRTLNETARDRAAAPAPAPARVRLRRGPAVEG